MPRILECRLSCRSLVKMDSFTILWIFLGVFASLIVVVIVITIILCRKARKSRRKRMNHQRKLSAAIIENFQSLEELQWPYSRQTRDLVFQQDLESPWAHIVRNGPIYDAGASMNRPWIVGKRFNPIYDGNDSNRSTLQSVYRYEERKWKPMGSFYDVYKITDIDSKTDRNAKSSEIDTLCYLNGGLQLYERFSVLTRINQRQSIVSVNDIEQFRRDRTDSDLTDPTEDPSLWVKMNKKRTSLVVNEAERQKKSRTGDFYAKNKKKLENYEENLKHTGGLEKVTFEY